MDRLYRPCFVVLAIGSYFELVFEFEAFYWNGILGYGSVKTLTNTSTRNCKGDLVEFKPTIMIGVAAVWETVRKLFWKRSAI